MTSQLIGRFAGSAERSTHREYGRGPLTRFAADLVVPRQTLMEVATLKGIAAVYVMTAGDRLPLYAKQRDLLAELVAALLGEADRALEPSFRQDWEHAAGDEARLRTVVDQVASLTDASAVQWHRKLTR